MIELRCPYKLHGILVQSGSGILEVACDSSLCGWSKGNVVLHQFNLETGSLTKTMRFKQPNERTKGGTSNNRPSVRTT